MSLLLTVAKIVLAFLAVWAIAVIVYAVSVAAGESDKRSGRK